MRPDASTLDVIRGAAHPLIGSKHDYTPLLEAIGDARFVLLGEATHGTHELYLSRAQITERLIEEKGFSAVAVEADWPDAFRVNRFVRGLGRDAFAVEALSDFERFPTWMWRNTVVAEFVEWLREHNDRAGAAKVGFYGLDLYSLNASKQAVLRYLRRVDPAAAKRAEERYSCFEQAGRDTQLYGFAVTMGLAKSCEEEVLAQLLEMQRHAAERSADEEVFSAEQNARLVKNAEAYYRAVVLADAASWNLRDTHMAETLEALSAHLERRGMPPRIVVWAHNSHLGDARATEMTDRGEINVGQLMRERAGEDAFLVGFTTHHGSVTAASSWDGVAERKRVRPALEGSYEALLHEVGIERFLLLFHEREDLRTALRGPLLERAIGVVYRPETERQSHYFHARLSDQFDAVVHFDETRAVEPLERGARWERGEAPETFPFAV